MAWYEKNLPGNYCDALEEQLVKLYVEGDADYQERVAQSKTKLPAFKVGDRVRVRTADWLDPTFTGKITMVGILDNDLGGGMPFDPDPDNQMQIYAYSIERDRGEWGVFIYKGVPEFYLTGIKSKKSKEVVN